MHPSFFKPMSSTQTLKPETRITRDHPLIILQTSDRFEDHTAHGREVVRVWKEAVPEDIQPYCQLQVEMRIRDHEQRYQAFRRLFDETEKMGVPTCIQFADPHDIYVFDPVYVEKLLEEYPSIKTLGITEMRFEHYSTFNVPRYALPPETRYAIDILHLGTRYGKHVSMSFQSLKWMHIGVDHLNQPLVETIRELGEYCLPQNEHLGPQHFPRQTSVWGFWIGGFVQNWGIEPQSWWFENGRMLKPGLFGQDPDNTRLMPPLLYRAMILEGIKMGATVFQFEPFWDLFDYDNSICWREVIYPTLRQAIQEKWIPSREEVLEKIRVAYHLKAARDINEFHENLRDVDWIADEGFLARAAYGLWEKFLEHELIPNKGKYYYIPLLPPLTPPAVLEQFEEILSPGSGRSEPDYVNLLDRHYSGDGEGSACIMSIGEHVYVMQTHENLYEKQTYSIELPRKVRGLCGVQTAHGLEISWAGDSGAVEYEVYRIDLDSGDLVADPPTLHWKVPPVARTKECGWCDPRPRSEGASVYTVLAKTGSREQVSGTVNYLDYLVFSLRKSLPAEWLRINSSGEIDRLMVSSPIDNRPDSQVVYPTFEGAPDSHRAIAEEIVAQIDAMKRCYDARDWRGLTGLYSRSYRDPNGFSIEYVGCAWKWWLIRNNTTCLLRQIRRWDFTDYVRNGQVHVKMFSLFRALRRDDQPFGYGWSGTLRIPRNKDEEVRYTWIEEEGGIWRLIHTDPAVPNLAEILWNHRGSDQTDLKLIPGLDD